MRLLVILFFLIARAAATQADTAAADCIRVAEQPAAQAQAEPCTFSQRQGHIGVSLDSGDRYQFSPAGDGPGTYRDAAGQPVTRDDSLAPDGLAYDLVDGRLEVHWLRTTLACGRLEIAPGGLCRLGEGGSAISVLVSASGTASLNRLELAPRGLTAVNRVQTNEIDGVATGAELADLDANGWPEVYVYVSSAGSGSYGSLVAYAVNRGKSMSGIYLPELSGEAAGGYMGHDEFAVVENRLVRRFPVYLPGDSNSDPGGGMRQLQYRLEAGEASWQLVLDKVTEY